MDRRFFITLLALALAGAAPAFADSGSGSGGSGSDSDGGSGGSGSDSDGGSGGSGSGSDSGSDSSGHGGDDGNGDEASSNSGDGQKKAREAARNGKAASLRDILRAVQSRYGGDIVDVNLRGKGERLTYRIKLVTSDGRRLTIDADAHTKRLVKVSGG